MSHFRPEQSSAVYNSLNQLIASSGDLNNQLTQLRRLVEGVYKDLSADSGLSFSGLFARMQYVHETLQAPSEIVAQLNRLRVLANKAVHETDFKTSSANWTSSVLALRNLLQWLDPGTRDLMVEDFIKNHGATPFATISFETPKKSFLSVVQTWEPIEKDTKISGLKIIAILDDGSQCTIFLNDFAGEGRKWSRLNKVLWKYCSLSCQNLSAIAGKDRYYQSNPNTFVVVEPDFLVDASAIAECFTQDGIHPEFFILNRMQSEGASEKPVMGSIANEILDELVSSPDADYEDLFRLSMAKKPISLVALGLQSAMNVFHTIKTNHFKNIRDFTRSLANDAVQLEPSYISPQNGMQGRLDILYERDGKRHIVELKSGKPPLHDVWSQHKMQVAAYNMILQSSGSSGNLGFSSIFYSAAREKPLRHVASATSLEQNLIMCRNRIVGILRGLATDPGTFFDWLRNSDFSNVPPFIQNNLDHIKTILNSIQEHEYQWLMGQIRLMAREIWFEKIGGLGLDSIYGHNALWQESADSKRERYRILSDLKVDQIDFAQVQFTLSDSEAVTDFRSGDIVVLYRQGMSVEKQDLLRGRIDTISETELTVTIRGGLHRRWEDFKNHLWSLEHDILESSLYSPLQALFAFMSAQPRKRNLLLGLEKPRVDEIANPATDELERVIRLMFAAQDYHIVQGPPGTGKTSGLLTRYIKKLYTETDKTVLILSFTNRAVDEICRNLRKHGIDFIRTGQSDEIDKELMDSRIQGKRFKDVAAILGSCRVWVATVQSCNSWLADLQKLIKIDELVIDEASQIMENSILGIISKIPKTILVGDQNQLPPISRQSEEGFGFTHEKLQNLCYDSYSQSLMERLGRVCKSKAWDSSVTMLHQHFRMHDEIAGLVQHYYGHGLVSMIPRQKELLNPQGSSFLDSRLTWVEFPPSEFAWYDLRQVDYILKLLELFQRSGQLADPVTDFGIVAPFRAMIHALRRKLPQPLKAITIDTVERFQGSERKNIIITLPLRGPSFLRNVEAVSADGSVDRKLNVAVSRAQERLYVLGCSDICSRSRHYKLLMDKIHESGQVFHHNDPIQI